MSEFAAPEAFQSAEESNRNSTAMNFLEWSVKNQEICRSIFIAIPVRPGGAINTDLARMLSVWSMAGIAWSDTSFMSTGFIESTRCGMAWNFLNDPISQDQQFLIMIDDDMVPEAGDVWLPYMLARHQQAVVGGCALTLTDEGFSLCFSRKDTNGDWRFPLMTTNPIPEKGLVEVGHCGTGAICIRKDVIASFSFEKDDPDGHPFFVPTHFKKNEAYRRGSPGRGEDVEFCAQVRRRGFKVYVDLEAHIGHRKPAVLRWHDNLRSAELDPSQWILPAEGTKISGP